MTEKLSPELTALLREAGAEGPWIYMIDREGNEVERLLDDSRVDYLDVDEVPSSPPRITEYVIDKDTGKRVYTVVSLRDPAQAEQVGCDEWASDHGEDRGQDQPAAPVGRHIQPLAVLRCHAQSVRYVKFEGDANRTVHRWLSTNRWGLVTGKRWDLC